MTKYIEPTPEEKKRIEEEKKKAKVGCFRKMVWGIFGKKFNRQDTFNKIVKDHPCLSKVFIKRFVKRRFGGKLTQTETNLLF
mmetsp:Transcript_5045/g.4240  ORF Transcript_5045/g.4240 Transcript_5045/m.4240 type:complete len:82 (+) Transcript_5045:306-551(+)